MGKYRDIKDKLVSELESIQKDSSAMYHDVYTAPRQQYQGYPSAVIVPTQSPSDFGSVVENDRVHNFSINSYISIANKTDAAMDAAFNTMYDIADLVLNHFDKDPELDGLVTYVNPAVGDWLIDPESNTLIFEMTLEVRHSVNIETI